jgi:molybdopterin-containing oxidoreductase family membrane subunit
MLLCNSAIPFTLFVKKWRRSLPFLYVLSIFVNIGMWLERFVIITTSLSKDFDPYSWGIYKPALVEAGITLGSFGFFFMLFLLFTKLLPVVAISELKEVADE